MDSIEVFLYAILMQIVKNIRIGSKMIEFFCKENKW